MLLVPEHTFFGLFFNVCPRNLFCCFCCSESLLLRASFL